MSNLPKYVLCRHPPSDTQGHKSVNVCVYVCIQTLPAQTNPDNHKLRERANYSRPIFTKYAEAQGRLRIYKPMVNEAGRGGRGERGMLRGSEHTSRAAERNVPFSTHIHMQAYIQPYI